MKKKTARKKVVIKTSKSVSKRRSFMRSIFLFLVIVGLMWAMAGLQIGRHVIRRQFVPCANAESCIRDLSGSFDPTAKTAVFMGKTVTPPTLAKNTSPAKVLGENTGEPKHIYIDLAQQRLYGFEGNKLVYNFLVSTGKWNRTPTGDFKIWIKLRYTRMSGGNQALGTYYNLPNVPYTMFLYNSDYPKSDGYGIHGAYWHNNFGQPMSHGCINMKEEDVAQLYNWAEPETEGSVTYATTETPGTPVTIYGVAPSE